MLRDITNKLNRYMPSFNKIDFEGILKDMDQRIDAAAAGEMPALSIGTGEIADLAITSAKVDATITASLALADSAMQSLDAGTVASLALADTSIQPDAVALVADATAAGTLADLAAAEAAIDALKDVINGLMAAMKTGNIMAEA